MDVILTTWTYRDGEEVDHLVQRIDFARAKKWLIESQKKGRVGRIESKNPNEYYHSPLALISRRISLSKVNSLEDRIVQRFPVLRCEACHTEYAGEIGVDYTAGVLCPEERKQGRVVVGVCHVVRFTERD